MNLQILTNNTGSIKQREKIDVICMFKIAIVLRYTNMLLSNFRARTINIHNQSEKSDKFQSHNDWIQIERKGYCVSNINSQNVV